MSEDMSPAGRRRLSPLEARLIARQKADWDDLAQLDPLWSILAMKGKRGSRWDKEEFFQTGEDFFTRILQVAIKRLNLPRERRAALDFGCGVGRLTASISRRTDHCLALDIAPHMVDQARSRQGRPSNATFDLLDPEEFLNLPASSFDLICCYLVLQHQPRPLLEMYIDELVRLLRPGGLLFFQLPTGIGWFHWVQPRRRLYRVLRDCGVAAKLLYGFRLHPISMHWRREAWVRQRVADAGGEVRLVEREGSGGYSHLYYVTKGA